MTLEEKQDAMKRRQNAVPRGQRRKTTARIWEMSERIRELERLLARERDCNLFTRAWFRASLKRFAPEETVSIVTEVVEEINREMR